MDFSKVKYSSNDVIKLVGFLIMVGGMWYDLKTDFAVHREEHKLLEYRLAQLESKLIVAVKPKEPKIETE